MSLRFIGTDDTCNSNTCPTVWVDEANADLVIQGWSASPELLAQCLAVGSTPVPRTVIPDDEAVVRIPARMIPALREACDAAERAHL